MLGTTPTAKLANFLLTPGLYKMTHEIVAYMPIKLNSKRVKNKSIREFCGRPLMCWSLEKLDKLNIPVFVYSSSCDVIKSLIDFDIKNILFCDRIGRLDNDDVVGIDIYKSFRNKVDSKNYILTHCTSPFINMNTYTKALESMLQQNMGSVFTVVEEKTFCWFNGKKINFNLPRNPNPIFRSGVCGNFGHLWI